MSILAAYAILAEPRRGTGKAEGGTADAGEGVTDGVEILRIKTLIVTRRPPTHTEPVLERREQAGS